MQTFLTSPDFAESARALDRARLGKQRVEAWQILRALRGETRDWRNHPAVKMWRGYEAALCRYAIAVCDEWIGRGYRDSMRARFVDAMPGVAYPPPWLTPEFCRAHRSNLVRKMPEHYGAMWPDVPADLPYLWPVE